MAETNNKEKPHLSPVESLSPKPQAKYLQVRDLRKYQHYKDRNPPWVKLYGEQLEDYEFQQLPDSMKFHSIALTYLAAKTGNKIPNDPAWVGSRIGARDPVDLEILIQYGFLETWQPRLQEPLLGEQLPLAPADGARSETNPTETSASGDASKMLASCYQSASTETETEGETEPHTETDTGRASAGRTCVCCGLKVFSRFTYNEALLMTTEWKRIGKIVGNRPVENPGGLARKLHVEGTADAELEAFLHPQSPPQKRAFTDELCKVCFGSKQEIVPGKGARPCANCVDEQGHRTGKEPVEAIR